MINDIQDPRPRGQAGEPQSGAGSCAVREVEVRNTETPGAVSDRGNSQCGGHQW